jgi:hypothetical protein
MNITLASALKATCVAAAIGSFILAFAIGTDRALTASLYMAIAPVIACFVYAGWTIGFGVGRSRTVGEASRAFSTLPAAFIPMIAFLVILDHLA